MITGISEAMPGIDLQDHDILCVFIVAMERYNVITHQSSICHHHPIINLFIYL